MKLYTEFDFETFTGAATRNGDWKVEARECADVANDKFEEWNKQLLHKLRNHPVTQLIENREHAADFIERLLNGTLQL